MKFFLAGIVVVTLIVGIVQADEQCAEKAAEECGENLEVADLDEDCSPLGEAVECIRQIPDRCNIVDKDDLEAMGFVVAIFEGLEEICENQDEDDNDITRDLKRAAKRAAKRAVRRSFKRAFKRSGKRSYKRSY